MMLLYFNDGGWGLDIAAGYFVSKLHAVCMISSTSIVSAALVSWL
jgi:hypothetical protein